MKTAVYTKRLTRPSEVSSLWKRQCVQVLPNSPEPKTIQRFLAEARQWCVDNIGLAPPESRVRICSPHQWRQFCAQHGYTQDAEGVYIPTRQRAVVVNGTRFFWLNLLHECCGHGIFFQHSTLAKSSDRHPADLHANAEGFALWLEATAAAAFGLKRLWQEKVAGLPFAYRAVFERFVAAERAHTRLGFLKQLGFAQQPTPGDVARAVRTVLAPMRQKVTLCIWYGSRRAASDIDVLIISGARTSNLWNTWLDAYILQRQDLESLLRVVDVSLLGPLVTGDVVIGDRRSLMRIRHRFLHVPITDAAIAHNDRQATRHHDLLQHLTPDSREYRVCGSYARSYERYARVLRRGTHLSDLIERGLLDPEHVHQA
jgi:hypothetical protein